MADFFNRTGVFQPLFGQRRGESTPRPVNTVAPILALEDGEFTITPGSWTGAGTITLSYVRLRDGVPSGTVTSPFNKVEADEGTTVSVVETATDDNGSRGAASNGIEVALTGAPDGAYLTEDGAGFYITEDGENYYQQEAA